VNPATWTSWKAQLLEELYLLAKPVIENKLTLDDIYKLLEESSAKRVEAVISSLSEKVSRDVVENHFENLIEDDSYLAVFTDSEIKEHIRKIVEVRDKKVDVIFSNKDGYTEITVITKDAPFVLANICGVLSANDANIFDARIFTRKDGIVIDKFRVFDYVSGVELSMEQCRKIERDLNDVFNGLINLDKLFEKHRRKWRRKIERTKKDVKIAVEFEDSKDYTVIDIFAPDSLGFLYKVSRKMSELGLNIYFAKIATRVDGVVDSFYVLDLNGNKIDDDNLRKKIKNEILNVIYELNNLKLISK
jgi:[protein-PII] uridylyltransferase